jgi:hypothetical protein
MGRVERLAVLILIYEDRIDIIPFGHRLANTQPVCVVAFAREIDRNRGSCEWFFTYVAACWCACEERDPRNFVIIDDYGKLFG